MRRMLGNRGTLLRALAVPLLTLALLATWATAAHAATLGGTVTSQTGGNPLQALTGATVTISTTGGTPVTSAVTGAGGTYSGLTVADGTYDIEVTASGWEAARFEDVALAGSATQDATLVPTGDGRVHGIVRDDAGFPVAGASVRVGSGTSTTTAVDGTFSAAAAQSTTGLTITGGATGATWTLQARGFVLPRDQAVELDVPDATQVTVEVVGTASAPIAGARVRVPALWRTVTLAPGLSASISSDQRFGFTDVAGEVDLTVLDGGVARGYGSFIQVYNPGNFYIGDTLTRFTIAGPTLVRFALTRYAELTFSVIDDLAQPVGTTASLKGGTERTNNFWPTPGADPVVLQTNEGTSILTARDWDYQFVSDPFNLAGAQTEVLELPERVYTDLVVVDPSGDPVEDAFVRWPISPVSITSGWIDGTAWVPAQTQTTYALGLVRVWHFDGATPDPARPGEIAPPGGSGLASRTFTLADVVSGRVALARR